MKRLHDAPGNWKPTNREKGRLWIGFAAVFFALAAVAYTTLSRSPSSGRRGWIRDLFDDAFGQYGDVVLWSFAGASALFYGIVLLRRKEEQ